MKWQIRKFYLLWRVTRPSGGWAGDFKTWDEAMAWATSPGCRAAFAEDRDWDEAFRLMWIEGLTL